MWNGGSPMDAGGRELIVRRSLNIVINTMFTCGAHNVEGGTKWEGGKEGQREMWDGGSLNGCWRAGLTVGGPLNIVISTMLSLNVCSCRVLISVFYLS